MSNCNKTHLNQNMRQRRKPEMSGQRNTSKSIHRYYEGNIRSVKVRNGLIQFSTIKQLIFVLRANSLSLLVNEKAILYRTFVFISHFHAIPRTQILKTSFTLTHSPYFLTWEFHIPGSPFPSSHQFLIAPELVGLDEHPSIHVLIVVIRSCCP